jgi:signal transduction histidine kinase
MAEHGKRRVLGIRPRITLVAASIVAVALIAGALLFWFSLRASLQAQVEDAARQDAAAFAELLDDDPSAETLPDVDDDRFWQVVDDESGAVVAASDAAEDAPPLADGDRDAPATVVLESGGSSFATATERDGDVVVVAGRARDQTDGTLAAVAALLGAAVPVVVALVALTTWIAVGRSLAPVERLRRQVDSLSGADLSRRVDDPGTGDELSSLARTMNQMLGRLQGAQATQRRFISDASHELKSPLASLRQYAEVASAYPDRISQAELAEVVLDEGARLESLVQGMLVLSRADEGALGLRRADVDLQGLLAAEAGRIRATSAVAVELDPRPARVSGDPGLLSQALRNLVDNAARHARSTVRLTAVAQGGTVFVIVEDDGAGIPDAERTRVFERFVRLDEARSRDAGGSGLGLAIVREIARAHGGDARADASPLGGARVTLTLPA